MALDEDVEAVAVFGTVGRFERVERVAQALGKIFRVGQGGGEVGGPRRRGFGGVERGNQSRIAVRKFTGEGMQEFGEAAEADLFEDDGISD